jgi:multidrug transporter EmrE-like cation transporter
VTHIVAGATHKALITWPLFSLILVSVSFSALAQICLKHGMSVPGVQTALAGGGTTTIALAVASSPMVWVGLFLYGFSALVWLFVLARVDVSVAYAFVALGFLLTMTLGILLLGEALTVPKMAGTLLVVLGVWLVAAW